jgi:hypothetical protein
MTDLQTSFDLLYKRKQFYKKAAYKHLNRVKRLEKEILRHRAKYKKEIAMKKWWKYACITVGTGMAVLIVLTLIVLQVANLNSRQTRIPTSANIQRSPASMLASVNILNGDQQGSGTVISQGESKALILSTGHNFKGVLGNTFWVYFADGSYTKATLLALDRQRDLAAASVDSDAILGRSFIPETVPDGKPSGIGYTRGQGPNYRTLAYNRSEWNKSRCVWEFVVTSGPFWDVYSGGGVFINDGLIAVTTERDPSANYLYACSLKEIQSFLKENSDKFEGCGDYSEPLPIKVAKVDVPPLWAPKPNIPIHIESPLERAVQNLKIEVESLKIKPVDIKTPVKSFLKRPSEVK